MVLVGELVGAVRVTVGATGGAVSTVQVTELAGPVLPAASVAVAV